MSLPTYGDDRKSLTACVVLLSILGALAIRIWESDPRSSWAGADGTSESRHERARQLAELGLARALGRARERLQQQSWSSAPDSSAAVALRDLRQPPMAETIEPGVSWRARIVDVSGQLNLNLFAGDGGPAFALTPDHPRLARFRRLLLCLGVALAADPSAPGAPRAVNPLEPADVEALCAARVRGTFQSKGQVEEIYRHNYDFPPPAGIALNPEVGRAKWAALRPYVTVTPLQRAEGLRDGFPVGYQGAELPRPTRGAPREHWPDAGAWQDAREPLIPVNVNSAPVPVLEAIFAAGLRGGAMAVESRPGPAQTGNPAVVVKAEIEAISQDEARRVAGAMDLARRETFVDRNGNGRRDPEEPFTDLDGSGRYDGPFTCFQDLLVWASTPAVHARLEGDAEMRRRKWALLLANANPNTLYNKTNPDWPAPRGDETFVDLARVDRTDLGEWSTFLVFGPTGYFEIEALGRVAGQGEVPAEEVGVRQLVRIARLLHHTSQRDFECATVESTALTHPESMVDRLGAQHPGSAAARPEFEYDGRIAMNGESVSTVGDALHLAFQGNYGGGHGLLPQDPAPSPMRDQDLPGRPRSLLDGSDLLPDGTISRSAPAGATAPETLCYRTGTYHEGAGLNLLTTGSIEFWIKLMRDGGQGGDESWVFAVQDDREHDLRGPGGGDVWIAWKLEYVGGAQRRLVSTRFYFLHSALHVNAPLSPWPCSWSERIHDIHSWRAHEWHHVSVSWRGAGLDGGNSHVFRIDGDAGAVAFDLPGQSWERGGAGPDLGRPARNLFALLTNVTAERFSLGGYTLHGPVVMAGGLQPVNAGGATGFPRHRFVSATIDEVRVRAAPAPVAAPSRYLTRTSPGPGAQRHRGRFVLPADLPTPARLANMAWTAYFPMVYGDRAVPSAALAPALQGWVRRGEQVISTTAGPDDPHSRGGGVVFVGEHAGVTAEDAVDYEWLLLDRGSGPHNVTPVIDDVTLTVLTPTEVVECRWSEP